MTAWDRERWRKLYLREPLEQEAWPWHTRGLRNLLIQRAEDDGFVAKSRLALKIALRGDELFQQAVDLLLDDGFLVENEFGLHVRNLPIAQGDEDPEDDEPVPAADETPEQRRRRLARARAKKARASRKQRDGVRTQSVTDSVTERDAAVPSPSPLASPLPLPSQPNKPEETSGSGARERDAERDGVRTQSVTDSVTERDAETPCPFDLVDRAREVGLVASMAKRLEVREADVTAVTAEFVEFWVVTRGGQRQRNWMGKLRSWIERKARAGELVGAGKPEPQEGEPKGLHPRAAERLARQEALAQERQRELAKTVGDKPVPRNLRALTEGIGG